jgi:hypothetical protein
LLDFYLIVVYIVFRNDETQPKQPVRKGDKKMETPNFNKEILSFNKTALKTSLDALSAFSDQAAVATDFLLGSIPSVPEEGKKAVTNYFKEGKKGLDSLKKSVENSLDLDWSAKDTPVKNLEAMETFCKDALNQAVEIKKETKALVEKATKQLPKEVKPLVDFWNESVNNSFEFCQSYMNKNFELAKKVMTDVAAVTPSAESKATK